jgi:hypothetical protein
MVHQGSDRNGPTLLKLHKPFHIQVRIHPPTCHHGRACRKKGEEQRKRRTEGRKGGRERRRGRKGEKNGKKGQKEEF